MNQKLEPELLILGNNVYQVDRTITKVAAFDELVEQVKQQRGGSFTCTPPLPAQNGACRVYAEYGKVRGMLMQNNPGVKEINYHDRNGHGEDCRFKVSLPWIWILCVFREVSKDRFEWCDCWLAATYEQIHKNDLSEPMYIVPLPNQYDGGRGRMCTGNAFTGMDDSMSATAAKWCRGIWDSSFNSDLSPRYVPALRSEDDGDTRHYFERWEKLSEKNPLAALDKSFGLYEYNESVRGFIHNALSHYVR